jgi:hypothetical protein
MNAPQIPPVVGLLEDIVISDWPMEQETRFPEMKIY